MKRRAVLLLALAAAPALAWPAAQRYERGLLWRVARKGEAPSHVYGTIHDSDARLADLPAAVNEAFAHSRSLMVEFLPDAYSRARFTEAALFAGEHTLEQTIGAADFARVLEQLAPLGLAPDVVNKFKPWGALINLRHTGAAEAMSVDAQLLARARERRIPVAQLEGVEEQIFTFDECPMDSQMALLRHSLAHHAELVELASRTLDAYLARDLAAIWRLREEFIRRYPEVAAHQAVMTKRLLYDRSVVMAFRMQRELRRGDAFVALGALHLYGPQGVLALLERDGYRATRVF